MKRILAGLLGGIFILTACTAATERAVLPPASRTPAFTATTFTPSPTSTFTATPLPIPTVLSATPTITPTLAPIRRTPPTLMLHRPNYQFDSLAFLKDFVRILKQNDMKVVTYRDIYKNPEITATEEGRLFIITIDDISLPYPMDPHVIEMIAVLREAGYPAVLGVVTETDYPDAGNVARLKELAAAGWEIASHTSTHANLQKLERASPKLVYAEVSSSLDRIEKALGVRPITLILPDGQMVDHIASLSDMDIHWVAGINGGVTYDSRRNIIYVGREGPAKDAEYTFKIMKMRFGF